MLKSQFSVGRLAIILGVLFLASGQLKAQSYSLGPNVGTFSDTETNDVFDCTDVYTYTEYTFSGFVYTSVDGVQHSIPGSTYADRSNDPACNQAGPTITYNGTAYTLVIVPDTGGGLTVTVTVPGYVNPKFVVLGVTYAPPGHLSFVQYSNSTLVSNTSSVSNSFASGYTVTVKIGGGGGIFGWLGGSGNTTSSTSWGQETDTSSSTTVSKQTGISLQVPGPVDDFVGVDHDYDIIWVWLNPVELFTLTNNGIVEWDGYGYSTQDQNAMDVIGVYVGCLNGVFSQSYCNSQYQTPFARSWAADPNEEWPSGQGPGLTSTDLQNILLADPYGQCIGSSPVGASACPSPDATRFTQTLNQTMDYQQPPPGGQPFTTQYTESYTTATSSETSYTHTHSQTFGRERVFSTQGTQAIFGIGFDLSIAITRTMQHTHKASTKFETSNTSTSEASITGPSCTVVNNACSPVYPPNPLDYGSAISFIVYQDNVFGGFLLVPATY